VFRHWLGCMTVPKSNGKFVVRGKTHKYMAAHIPGLVQWLQ